MSYNPNIHHRRSIRLKGYDYSQAGLYFITICVQNRECLFGEIENGKMILNEFGQIAHNEWLKTPEIRNNVELGEFIVMPNHFHAIIRLLDNKTGVFNTPQPIGRGELHSPKILNETDMNDNIGINVTENKMGVNVTDDNTGVFNTPLKSPSQTVGAIVRGYKSTITKQLGLLGLSEKLWQRNYHEHIIRNEKSYQTISDYIINNPAKWSNDKFYME